MATHSGVPTPPHPSINQMLSMIDELITLLEKKIKEIQQLQDVNNHLQTKWREASSRLDTNKHTIRTLSSKIEHLEAYNDILLTENNTLKAQERRCPHKHQ